MSALGYAGGMSETDSPPCACAQEAEQRAPSPRDPARPDQTPARQSARGGGGGAAEGVDPSAPAAAGGPLPRPGPARAGLEPARDGGPGAQRDPAPGRLGHALDPPAAPRRAAVDGAGTCEPAGALVAPAPLSCGPLPLRARRPAPADAGAL